MTKENMNRLKEHSSQERHEESDANLIDLVEGKYEQKASEEPMPVHVEENMAARQEALQQVQERLAEHARKEVIEKSPAPEKTLSQNEAEQAALLAEMERSVGKPLFKMVQPEKQNAEQKTRFLLHQKDLKEDRVRGRISFGLVGGSALSLFGGIGAAAAGVAEASAAVTAGVIGMASFAGGLAVIPPALYLYHRFQESRRNKKFDRAYGKSQGSVGGVWPARNIWSFDHA